MRVLYVFGAFFTLFNSFTPSLACKGCVNLDEYSFDKILPGFEVVVIKFDIAYPFGDKHEAFKAAAQDLKDNKDVLFAEIGVKDYGDKENQEFAKRFGIDSKEDLPTLRLFVKGEDEPFVYEKHNSWGVDGVKKFIRDHTNLYLGLPGCIEKFDKLAMKFVASDDKSDVLGETETEKNKLQNKAEKEVADMYIKYMKKIIELSDNFYFKEKQRLEKLLSGKLIMKKRMELAHRLNILLSFAPPKTEL